MGRFPDLWQHDDVRRPRHDGSQVFSSTIDKRVDAHARYDAAFLPCGEDRRCNGPRGRTLVRRGKILEFVYQYIGAAVGRGDERINVGTPEKKPGSSDIGRSAFAHGSVLSVIGCADI